MTTVPLGCTRPVDLAQELVRLALLARLALELGDGDLARRASRYAAPVVRLLAGLEDDQPSTPLPEVENLLKRLRPLSVVDAGGEVLP